MMNDNSSPLLSQVAALRDAIGAVIVGQETVVEEVLLALFCGGHALLEGAPGLGKTLLVRTLARAVDLHFSRIQFTPDLMPSDITGTRIVVEGEGGKRFELQRGPVFGNVVLADEINRATPKTQSALLEAMGEGTVTIGGEQHRLEAPFFVLATENPIEMDGTYPLPEAQLDRFLFKIQVPAPDEDTLVAILERTTQNETPSVPRVMDRDAIVAGQQTVRAMRCASAVTRYAARIAQAADPNSEGASEIAKRYLRHGAGVRGAQSLILGAKAAALFAGRQHVAFEDVRRVAAAALRHRLITTFDAAADGHSPDSIVNAVVEQIPEQSATLPAFS
ncbi:MAG: AAA family ATPase [Myxococcota bacterium]